MTQFASDTIHMALFIQQCEAGRSPTLAGLVVKAMFPWGWNIGDQWVPGRKERKAVTRASRELAKASNPKRGYSDEDLRHALELTFATYIRAAKYDGSYAQAWWAAHYAVADDPSKDIKTLVAEVQNSYGIKEVPRD